MQSFLPVDMARYQEVSGHIMEIFESFTPNVEPVSVDEAFLDVTGAKKLLGTGREIAAAIRAKVEAQEGITCSVGIAPSKVHCKVGINTLQTQWNARNHERSNSGIPAPAANFCDVGSRTKDRRSPRTFRASHH
jgi:nucleotidyltransferase/DNA polymerase involved in DNA repair